jgi:hypothetical protein
MPGMENFAPERTETSSGAQRGGDLDAEPGRHPPVAHELAARLGGDGEPGRHGQADARHLGQVGALAAQQVAPVLAALVEPVYVLRHRPHRPGGHALEHPCRPR